MANTTVITNESRERESKKWNWTKYKRQSEACFKIAFKRRMRVKGRRFARNQCGQTKCQCPDCSFMAAVVRGRRLLKSENQEKPFELKDYSSGLLSTLKFILAAAWTEGNTYVFFALVFFLPIPLIQSGAVGQMGAPQKQNSVDPINKELIGSVVLESIHDLNANPPNDLEQQPDKTPLGFNTDFIEVIGSVVTNTPNKEAIAQQPKPPPATNKPPTIVRPFAPANLRVIPLGR